MNPDPLYVEGPDPHPEPMETTRFVARVNGRWVPAEVLPLGVPVPLRQGDLGLGYHGWGWLLTVTVTAALLGVVVVYWRTNRVH